MTRIKSFARIAAALLLVAAVAVPGFAATRGSADFTRFVAIGDSILAGYNSGSLTQHHQQFAPPVIIARQVGLSICPINAVATDPCFAEPFIADPGLPTGELVFNGSTLVTAPGAGAPLMFGFGRSYNNLAVPGYTVGAALTLTGAEPISGLGQVILRGRGSEVAQALSQNPTFIMVWLGANDVLGAVSAGDPTKLTSTAAFTQQYNALLDALVAGAPNAGMVVGTLPNNLKALPLISRLPGVVFDSNFQPVTSPLINNGNPIPLIYVPAGSTTPAPVPPGSILLLSALARYQQGFGLPPQLKAVPPFSLLPHTGEPLTDAEIITPDEQAQFVQRVNDFNSVITSAAAARNIPVADIKGFYDRVVAAPLNFGGITLTGTWISGGIFGNDGTHFSDIGYTLFANEFIKTINAAYGTEIPLASIAATFQNNGANFGFDGNGYAIVSPEAAESMTGVFTSVSVPAPAKRHRTSNH